MTEHPENQPAFAPPVSTFTGPIGELIAQRMLAPPSRPGVLAELDHFEILRVLGGGGMGIVLLAHDSEGGRDVALKLVKSDLLSNPHIVHRFLKEAGHLKRLRHTNILPVQEISDRAEGPYFVMPYFEKGSLANKIKPGQPLDSETILDIATQLAEGLSFAHRSGIIHRDLKPANIMLGRDGQICLGDFGLARSLYNDTIVDVESRQMEGTAPYMSPAVAAGDAEDTRCDIYSFGALLYEMLTGRAPYSGRGTKEILDQILAGPPKPITSLNTSADRRLVAVAENAMARELRDRYADMRDVLKDLQRIKAGKPPVGPHETGKALLRKLAPISLEARLFWVPACLVIAVILCWRFWPGKLAGNAKPPVSQKQQTNSIPAQTPATTAFSFQTPWGIAVDRAHNIYVADKDRCTIGRITPDGRMTEFVAENGVAESPRAGGSLIRPRGIALDPTGNAYVTDSTVVRKVTPQGRISLLAGRVATPGSSDGAGDKARFDFPSGIAVDDAGNVYVADRYMIRRITPEGVVTTLAGMDQHAGNSDGTGQKARFSDNYKGLAIDNAGNLYVADKFNHAVRKMSPAGVVVTLAGSAHIGSADGKGSSAQFFQPCGIAVDASGNAYVTDSGNHTIRKITPDGIVSTLAGKAGRAGNADGPGKNALFDSPQDVAVDLATGDLYVTDTGNRAIRKITAAGTVSSVAVLLQAPAPTPVPPPVEIELPAGVEAVLKLARAGVGEAVILAKVKSEGIRYKLTDDEIIYLGNHGVTESEIVAMLEGK